MERKRWLKVVVTGDPKLAEPLSDFLVGILGAGVETGAKGEAGYGILTAWFDNANLSEIEKDAIIIQLKDHIARLAKVLDVEEAVITTDFIEEQDWGANWKKFFKPFAIVPGLVIVPSWEEYEPREGEQILVMDPGMAFGTGHHDTTGFSMEFIREAVAAGGRTLLDVGTGTGILGMAGLLFGATHVLGIDNDPDAVVAAEENALSNGLKEKMDVSIEPLSTIQGCFDIVVANIIHDVLISMQHDLAERVKPGGNLILSGILKGGQTENIKKVFTGRGFYLQGEKNGEEWAALHFIKS